jgi:hypothetical protein
MTIIYVKEEQMGSKGENKSKAVNTKEAEGDKGKKAKEDVKKKKSK